MCEAGRIKHHLKHNLWRPESTVLFVGYQANGSLGREILEGAKEVTLFGETIRVQAEIVSLKGISGHADREGLLDWASGFRKKPKRVFVVHGEDGVEQSFCALLHEKDGQRLREKDGGRPLRPAGRGGTPSAGGRFDEGDAVSQA